MARQRYDGALVDTAGSVVVGAKVRFYSRNADGSQGSLASTQVYTTENGSTLVTYPLTTDTYGRVAAFLEPGAYYVENRASDDSTVLQPDEFDSLPGRAGGVPWAQLADAARSVPLYSRMSVFGHSLPFGGGATDVDRDMMTHLASMLQVREMNYSKGGAILSWHSAEPDVVGNGGYANVLANHYRAPRVSTTVSTQYTAGTGTTLVVAAGTAIKTGDLINVGTGTNGETVYVTTGGSNSLTIKNTLTNTHVVGEPVTVVPSEYLAGSPLFIPWYGINDWALYNNTRMARKFIEPMRAIMARLRCAEFFDNTSTILVKSGGAWTEFNAASSPNYAGIATFSTMSVAPAGGVLTAHIPANFPGGTVDLFWVVDPATTAVTISYTVDGVAQGTAQDMTGSTLGYTGKYNYCVRRITGLSAGRHTIVATLGGTYTAGGVHFDGMGIEAAQPPMMLVPGFNRPATYGLWPSWDNSQTTTTFTSLSGTNITVASTTGMQANDTVSFANGDVRTVASITSGTVFVVSSALSSTPAGGSTVTHGMQDADVPTLNAQLQSLVAEFDSRVVYVDIDTPLAKNSAYFFHDGAHFSDKGHAILAETLRDALFSATGASPSIPAYLSVPTNPLPSEIVVLGGAPVGTTLTLTSVGQWVNQPAALTELFGSTAWRQLVDLKRAKEWRWYIGVTQAGLSGSSLRVQYSIDSAATWKYMDRRLGDLAEDPALATRPMQLVLTAAGWFSAGWHDIPPEAQIDTCMLRVVGINGNGTADPAIPNITIQFR